MSRKRAPKQGSKWYLPFNTFKTVEAFCYSYEELLDRLRDLDGMHSHEQDGMPRGNATSDPTASEGMKRAEIEKKIRVIEQAVQETVPEELTRYIFLGVTHREMTYDNLIALGMPLNKNVYSGMCREVYYRVAERIM